MATTGLASLADQLTGGWATPMKRPAHQGFLCQEHNNQSCVELFPREAACRGSSGSAQKVCWGWSGRGQRKPKRQSIVSARRSPSATGLPGTQRLGSTLPCSPHPHLTLALFTPLHQKRIKPFLFINFPNGGWAGGGHRLGGPVIQLTITIHEVVQNLL